MKEVQEKKDVFMDVNAILAATDGRNGLDDCKRQLDQPEKMSPGMSILMGALHYGPNCGVVLYTNEHVEFNVRRALSQPRFCNRTRKQTRPAWSQADINEYCRTYKSAVLKSGGSTSADIAKDDPRIAKAEGRNAPDHEDAVVFASAKASPATVLCTADREFRNMQTLDLQWPEDTLELWTLEAVNEVVFCAVQAYLLSKRKVAA